MNKIYLVMFYEYQDFEADPIEAYSSKEKAELRVTELISQERAKRLENISEDMRIRFPASERPSSGGSYKVIGDELVEQISEEENRRRREKAIEKLKNEDWGFYVYEVNFCG